jgi:SpoVK/Ycf46/Vps4 family AAA+-type ATPase
MEEDALGRFEKLIYVYPPARPARKAIMGMLLGGFECSADMNELADRTEGFSGRGVSQLCLGAIMAVLREANPGTDTGIKALEHASLPQRPIVMEDFAEGLESVKPIGSEAVQRFLDWKPADKEEA